MSTEAELKSIQQAITSATALRARAEVDHEQAEEAVGRLRSMLREEFGIEKQDDARQVMADLDRELEEAVAEAREHLANAQ